MKSIIIILDFGSSFTIQKHIIIIQEKCRRMEKHSVMESVQVSVTKMKCSSEIFDMYIYVYIYDGIILR